MKRRRTLNAFSKQFKLFRKEPSPSQAPSSGHIDHTRFPGLVNRILSYSTRDTLLRFRLVNKSFKQSAEKALCRHIRFSASASEIVEAPHGPLPFLPGALAPPELNKLLLPGSECDRRFSLRRRSRAPPSVAPSTPTFASTHVVDISVRDPPPLVYSVLARSPVSVIRLTPNVKLSQVSHALPEKPAGLTVVHFWMEKSCLLPAFPEPIVARITKVVFTVRHYAAVPLWLQWYELQNTQYPNLASVVFVFPSDGGPRWITDPIYLHRENTTQHRPYMFAAFAEQVAAILLSTQAHISIVALRDVPHQRFLGLPIVESVSGVELEECFLDQVETELHRLAPEVNVGLDTIPFCLARIETIPLPEYRGRLGRDEFELEVNA